MLRTVLDFLLSFHFFWFSAIGELKGHFCLPPPQHFNTNILEHSKFFHINKITGINFIIVSATKKADIFQIINLLISKDKKNPLSSSQ
jgi:hypothetical protein